MREQVFGACIDAEFVSKPAQVDAIVFESIGGRKTQNLDAETGQQMGGEYIGIVAGHDQIGRQRDTFLDRAVIDAECRRTLVNIAEIGVERERSHRHDASVIEQFEQQRVSAQIERGDTARRRRDGGGAQQQNEEQDALQRAVRRRRTASASSCSSGSVVSHDMQASVMLWP